jgi:hypothetical protein
MDLFAIAQTIWRHRLATFPVLLVTFAACVYVVAVQAPVYVASSSYILISPPPAPTPEEIDKNPALARVKSDNIYTRFGNAGVLVDVLTRTAGDDAARDALVKAGADPRYTVGPSMQFGFGSPIIDITGVGSTAPSAIRSAQLVGRAVTRQLDQMQARQGVDPRYRITSLQIEAPDRAELRASGQMRRLIGVLALGGLLLFVVVSILNAVAERRAAAAPGPASPSGGAPVGAGGPRERTAVILPQGASTVPPAIGTSFDDALAVNGSVAGRAASPGEGAAAQ